VTIERFMLARVVAAAVVPRSAAESPGTFVVGGTLSIKMHDKLAALVALGKHLGMFVQRTQNTNVHYLISDKPMTENEWKKRYVTPH
jgi:hypothetical protein